MNDLDIKYIRKKLGISQKELAEILGVHYRTIQNYEDGGVIPKAKHTILCKLLEDNAKKEEEPQSGEQMKFDFSALIRVSEKTAEAVQTIANSNEKMAESNRLLAETNAEMWQTIKGKLERIEELLEKKGGNVQGIPRVV